MQIDTHDETTQMWIERHRKSLVYPQQVQNRRTYLQEHKSCLDLPDRLGENHANTTNEYRKVRGDVNGSRLEKT